MKRFGVLAFLVLALPACGDYSCKTLGWESKTPFATSQGAYVNPQGHDTSPGAVEYAIQRMGEKFAKQIPTRYSHGALQTIFSQLNIEVRTKGYIPTSGPFKDQFIVGETVMATRTIWYEASPCIGDTALAHELAHYIPGFARQDVDVYHQDETRWGKDGIVQQVNDELREKFCSCGY
jgi:hypothetical protein